MPKRITFWQALLLIWFALTVLLILVVPFARTPTARADAPQATCLPSACAANCVAHQFALGHRNLEVFSRWYDTAYTLTGCDDPDWWTNFQFLLAIAAELVGAPGGYTMDCREMTLGQYDVCLDQCADNPCRYAPNVRVAVEGCGAGDLVVAVDNSRGEVLPEYQPTSYTRPFDLSVWLTGPSGAPLLRDRQEVTLSYPNWVTNGALSQCETQIGDGRCDLLAMFDLPAEHTLATSGGDGLYDLWHLMAENQGLDSWPGDDHLRLNGDGDTVTVSPEAVSGYVYERWRTKSGWGDWSAWSESVSPWNAYGGSYTVTNHESVAWHHWNKTDRDTLVFATEGPDEDLLTGSYGIEVRAEVAHDKDISDNVASCAFEVTNQPPPLSATATPVVQVTPTSTARDIGAGSLEGYLQGYDDEHLYRLRPPAGLSALHIRLSGMVAPADYDLELRRGEPGSPGALLCASTLAGVAEEFCSLSSPAPETYTLRVYSYVGSGPYTLTVMYDDATTLATMTPTPQASPTPTPSTYSGQTEGEPNDSSGTANQWDATREMRGQIGASQDVDYYAWTALESGIYAVALTAVAADIAPDLSIYHHGVVVASDYGAALGQDVTLRVDANAGDVFAVRVRASSTSQTSDQHYRLNLTFIADPNEPDDTRQQATIWDWQLGPAHGFFWERVSGDADFWQFTLPAQEPSALLTVHLDQVAASVAADLALYQDGDLVASAYDAAPGESVALILDANAGETFVVRVRPSARAQTSLQPYALRITTVDDPHEPNDEPGAATTWDFESGPMEGYFWQQASGRADYYRFTLPLAKGSGLITVVLDAVPAAVAADLAIYTAQGALAVSENAAAPGARLALTVDANAGESFVVRVRPSSFNQTATTPYSLALESVGDLPEPNDDFGSATEWDWQASVVQGYFWEQVSGDADYYRLLPPPGAGEAVLTVSLTDVAPEVAADLAIYSATRALIASSNDVAAGQPITLNATVARGEPLYVRVRPSSRQQVSAQLYTLSASLGADTLPTAPPP